MHKYIVDYTAIDCTGTLFQAQYHAMGKSPLHIVHEFQRSIPHNDRTKVNYIIRYSYTHNVWYIVYMAKHIISDSQ